MKKLLVVLFLCQISFPAVSEKKTKLKILALGDSLTAGYRLDKKKAFPAQLEKMLEKRGYAVSITNAGVSGDTAQQGYQRMDWVIKRAGPFKVLLLELGANDGLRQNKVSAAKDSLEKIIQKAQKSNMTIFLLGMKLPINFSEKYRKPFEAMYPSLAEKYKIPLYPFILKDVAQKSELNLSDLIHPNEEGYKIVAKNLADWLISESSFKKLF